MTRLRPIVALRAAITDLAADLRALAADITADLAVLGADLAADVAEALRKPEVTW
jgi:hypothetical protein